MRYPSILRYKAISHYYKEPPASLSSDFPLRTSSGSAVSAAKMEVLGAVAATGQLIGTGFAILDAIDQLRDFLKHAPDRCQGWRCQLDALSGTICDIRQNSQLQTYQVKRIIEDIAPKISTLTKLCAHYAPEPQPKSRLYKRLSKALSAKGIERRILQSFQSLEQDKTTLILSISTIHGPKGEEMASDQTRANGRSLCRGTYYPTLST